jgi:5-bromo-4-chloroindolyl phosphate hydrolysis protein
MDVLRWVYNYLNKYMNKALSEAKKRLASCCKEVHLSIIFLTQAILAFMMLILKEFWTSILITFNLCISVTATLKRGQQNYFNWSTISHEKQLEQSHLTFPEFFIIKHR